MRISIIVAAHNEGDSLSKTISSCVQTCTGLDHEIVVVDDASTDECVVAAKNKFPQLRVLRNSTREGASPAKALGAESARGNVLVFLDAHCNPEPGAIARLADDVEGVAEDAVIMPAIPSLCTATWKNSRAQRGNGYFLTLEEFDCGWMPLSNLRETEEAGRRFFESPAVIGCAFAVGRTLYEYLWGFDRHMRIWGVEDLDFSLKCWLSGHRILHDPDAVVGHRFQQSFGGFQVSYEQLVVNQLRMARKNFTHAAWADWVERCRQRNAGTLTDHPEGLWARVWEMFQADAESIEQERTFLQGNRARDEFWYAERFGLSWPRLESSAPGPYMLPEVEASPSPSPSPAPCQVDGIIFSHTPICLDEEMTFTADGTSLDDVNWETDPAGIPATGSGENFTTKWDSVGLNKKVTASCNGSSFDAYVDVVGVDEVIVDGTAPEDAGPVSLNNGTSIVLLAKRTPAPATGAWPPGQPTWSYTGPDPFGFSGAVLEPAGAGKVRFIPQLVESEAVPAAYTVTATCGGTSDDITINVSRCAVEDVSADNGYEKVAKTGSIFNVAEPKKAGENVRLTITVKTGTDTSLITWSGGTVVAGSNNLQADVPIDQSVRKDVVVKYDSKDCQEIRVWPVWVTLSFRGDNDDGQPLSAGNDPHAIVLSQGCPAGGPTVGLPAACAAGLNNQMEITGSVTPSGVSALDGIQYEFRRSRDGKAWEKDPADPTWTKTDDITGSDDTSNADEDTHDGNDTIYVVDFPGLPSTFTSPKSLVRMEIQFTEHVELLLNKPTNVLTPGTLGPKISDDLDWYTVLDAKKNTGGKWVRNAGAGTSNKIRTGTITVGNQPSN